MSNQGNFPESNGLNDRSNPEELQNQQPQHQSETDALDLWGENDDSNVAPKKNQPTVIQPDLTNNTLEFGDLDATTDENRDRKETVIQSDLGADFPSGINLDPDNMDLAELDIDTSELDNTEDLLPLLDDGNLDLEGDKIEELSEIDAKISISGDLQALGLDLPDNSLPNSNDDLMSDSLLESNSTEDSDSFLIQETSGHAEFTLDNQESLEIEFSEEQQELSLDDLSAESELATDLDLDFDDLELDLAAEENNLLEDSPGDIELDGDLDLGGLLEDAAADADLDGDLNLDDLLDDSPEKIELDGDLDLDDLLDDSGADGELDLDLDNLGLDNSNLDSLEGLGSLDDLLDEPQPETKPVPKVPIAPKVKAPAPVNDAAPVKAKTFDQTMRVSVRKLDNLNNLIGELVVKRNRLEEDQERIRRFMDNMLGHVQSLGEMGGKMHDLYERSLLEGALMASRQQSQSSGKRSTSSFLDEGEEESKDGELDALELDRFTGFHLLSQDIIELIVRVREAASDIQFVVDETDKVTQSLRQVTSQLQEGMNSSRMVPFGQTTDRLPRAIRDISRQLQKQVNLQVEGKDVLIDKMIVENLYNPMTHLVNNAITHGIETPEERKKQDKPVTGTLNIRAFLQGNQTVIAISDDGAGIDPERIKAKAVEKGLLTWAQAQSLSKQEVFELIFHAGFSTKDQADDFAGRGVGMDVVSTDLKKIRGTIGIESEVGKGTVFTIRLPLVLSICKAISCVFNNTRIAFPLDGVEAQKEFIPSQIKTNENGVQQIPWNNGFLPFQPLSNLLFFNRQVSRGGVYNINKEDDTISVVVLRSADNLLAVEVDQILGEQEIVIKQFEEPVPKPAGIAGATVLGDGIIMPIGDVLELIEIAQGKRTIELGFNVWSEKQEQQKAEAVSTEPTVLVVDDSITVRELLTLSFNKLGYRVEQARDGQEGWDKLRGGLPCDMIFCDIEMPRMNGLELLSNLQKEDKLKHIPVAMLTSRGADKHRQLATDLGAKAYLTKPYTEKDLMDVAQRLIEINREQKEAELMVVNSNETLSNIGGNGVKVDPLVLIIDDSVTVRELLSMTFKKAGYRVEQARDGQEAWDKLQDGLECDIAFCDIEMPRMNGLELLANLQEHELLSSLPIAMLTSRGAQKMRNIAAQRGAKGYFVKPYVEETLLNAAKKMMQGEVLIEAVDLDE